jgi:hypothetical protein
MGIGRQIIEAARKETHRILEEEDFSTPELG